ncbi:MAG: hypothetical protein C4532_07915 [Candidatus Abyssobacteria bacterium SURF_17]|uniref:Flagellar protein n=1 Tax=Candidatus Abyssobacteria bacterium SURF_17 TaxID=2093361 RepID=A0A419F0K6_9BACT|nr:MAG: hypothetical protein C4532_07915 [Candidatus Abyssubacteria bacterium SURF_17]
MPLTNCVRCGLLFSRTNRPVCPECIRKEEENFERAVEWLRNNPRQTIQAMSEATGIEKGDILKWVREKRIVLADASDLLRCKKCGSPIAGGSFCDHCKLGLTQAVSETLKEMSHEQGLQPLTEKRGMHYRPFERGRGARA